MKWLVCKLDSGEYTFRNVATNFFARAGSSPSEDAYGLLSSEEWDVRFSGQVGAFLYVLSTLCKSSRLTGILDIHSIVTLLPERFLSVKERRMMSPVKLYFYVYTII